jgi:dCMP deaminase
MEIAEVVAMRSTCARRAVGAVIVDAENRVLSTGYNGVPSGMRHCTLSPCEGAHMPSGTGLDVCQALHAEQNAIARLEQVRYAHTLYCTTSPCMMCTKLIAATPIQRIVAAKPYPTSGEDFWNALGRKWDNLFKD